jgi:hypothetical protein
MKDFGLCTHLVESFTEKYPMNKIIVIEKYCGDPTFQLANNYRSIGFKGVDIPAAISKFREFVEGFVEHRIENPDFVFNEKVINKTMMAVQTEMVVPKQIEFSKGMDFITEYMQGLEEINTFANQQMVVMNEKELSADETGRFMTYFDTFLNVLQEKVEDSVNRILYCAGAGERPADSLVDVKKPAADFFL